MNPLAEGRRRARLLTERLQRPVSGDSPIFVVGFPHSGTSLLLRCIGQHPHVYAIPSESRAFTKASTSHRVGELHHQWTAEAVAHGKSTYCEKSPDHVFHINRIHRYLPAARIAVIERDGRDAAASLARRRPASEAAAKWVRAVDAGRQWLNDPRVAYIRYEELVNDATHALAELADQLGIGYAPAMVEVPDKWTYRSLKPESEHGQRRESQVARPIFDGRGAFDELSANDQLTVSRIVDPTRQRLGFVSE